MRIITTHCIFTAYVPSTLVTCNFVPLQNAPWPDLAVYNSSIIGLYTMPISACNHHIMQIQKNHCTHCKSGSIKLINDFMKSGETAQQIQQQFTVVYKAM